MSDELPVFAGRQIFNGPTNLVTVDVLWEARNGAVFITENTAEILTAAGVPFSVVPTDLNGQDMLLLLDVVYNGCIIDAIAKECGARSIKSPS